MKVPSMRQAVVKAFICAALSQTSNFISFVSIGKQQHSHEFLLDRTVVLLNSVFSGYKLTLFKYKHPHMPTVIFLCFKMKYCPHHAHDNWLHSDGFHTIIYFYFSAIPYVP